MMMNKMREIYGVVNMILFPEDEDPEMLSLELFSSFAKAKERSEEIIKEYHIAEMKWIMNLLMIMVKIILSMLQRKIQ